MTSAMEWLAASAFASAAGISPRAARNALHKAMLGGTWNGYRLKVRTQHSRGGRSGLRYEVALSSLPEALQAALSTFSDDDCTAIVTAPPAAPAKFIAAPNQGAAERKRWAALRLISQTEFGTPERAGAIRDAARHHDIPVSTIQKWVRRAERHGWDMDALGRKRPADAGQKRVWISRPFDKAFLAANQTLPELEAFADWFTRVIAGIWQSPVQRAGWKRVRLEALTSLRIACEQRGLALNPTVFNISRRRVEELRYHSIVDIQANDAKRFDDAKPRIRRDNSRFAPMEQIVMDVKPLDCVLTRPDGSLAYPKLIGFMDTGTHRLFCRIVLLARGEGIRQEHVTDAFLDMVDDPDWGFPQQLYYDNGSEYAHFELIREALKMLAAEGTRVLIKAKPYSGASKPIESKFSVIDRQITALMRGYTGANRMDKKIQRMGRPAQPYPGTIKEFEAEFFLRLHDFHGFEIGSGPFKGKSPLQVYHEHLDNGWRPVSVHRLALDSAFAKRLGDRKIDRGTITIGPDRFRHCELAGFTGRRVEVVKPYRRGSWPLAKLPELGWIALEPEMLSLPGEVSGAIEAGRMQQRHRKTPRKLKANAIEFDPLHNLQGRVVAMPGRAASAPLIDVMMSPEAERFAGARIEAETKRVAQPSAERRLIERQLAETELLEKLHARGK